MGGDLRVRQLELLDVIGTADLDRLDGPGRSGLSARPSSAACPITRSCASPVRGDGALAGGAGLPWHRCRNAPDILGSATDRSGISTCAVRLLEKLSSRPAPAVRFCAFTRNFAQIDPRGIAPGADLDFRLTFQHPVGMGLADADVTTQDLGLDIEAFAQQGIALPFTCASAEPPRSRAATFEKRARLLGGHSRRPTA